jgi:hypothetical protein
MGSSPVGSRKDILLHCFRCVTELCPSIVIYHPFTQTLLTSQHSDQDTDGLDKALEASILRNEVISGLFIHRYKLWLFKH